MIFLLVAGVSLVGCRKETTPESNQGENAAQELSIETETPEPETSKAVAEKETGKSGDDSIYLSEAPDSEENILNNIDVKSEKSEDGSVVVFITNNNEYAIPDLEVQVLFKRGGETVDTGEDGHDVLVPGNTVVSSISGPESYDDFEVSASTDWNYGTTYRNWVYNLEVNSNAGDDGVIVQFKNIGDVDIEELEYIVVFYKGGAISGCSYAEDVYDFKAGEEKTEKADTCGIEFDEYEVYINQAHTFDEKYIDFEPAKDELPGGIGTR